MGGGDVLWSRKKKGVDDGNNNVDVGTLLKVIISVLWLRCWCR